MAAPAAYPIVFTSGDDWAEDFKIFQPGSTTAVQDLTGWTGRAQVKATAVDTAVVTTMTITFATDRTTGILTLSIAAGALTVGNYVYDVEFTRGGKIRTYISGTITVAQDVTR
jgi:hypothetical protein